MSSAALNVWTCEVYQLLLLVSTVASPALAEALVGPTVALVTCLSAAGLFSSQLPFS